MSEPRYTHDCDACQYVGSDTRKVGEPTVNTVDLYVHRNPSGKITLIRRYGSDGPNYAAWFLFDPNCVERIQYQERWRMFVPHVT